MKKVMKRLREPSSYASLAAVLALVGVQVDQEIVGLAAQVGAGIAGIVGFFMRDPGSVD